MFHQAYSPNYLPEHFENVIGVSVTPQAPPRPDIALLGSITNQISFVAFVWWF